jgi:asparagine synthase (glutamine-hydrolysing)
MNNRVLITREYKWDKISRNEIDIFFKGDLESSCLDMLFSLPFKSNSFVQQYVNTISINFAFIISTKNSCILAVDHIRSTPIIYARIHKKWYVDCRSSRILSIMGNGEIDRESSISVAMSGYTIGSKTLYKSVSSLVAGQIVFLKKSKSVNKIQYYQYAPNPIHHSASQFEYELKQVTLNILKKTISSLRGRQAVIPLSAGYDSRLIASGFKYLGYENVKCYSYGFENFESDTSKIIAKKLGYDWKLVKLGIKKEKEFYKSKEFDEYLEFSDVSTSIPVIRWLSTVRILKESKWIDKNAVFINGNSGDFISGGHINSEIYRKEKQEYLNNETDINLMLDLFLEKHYNLWKSLCNEQNKVIVKDALLCEYNKLLEHNNGKVSISSAYESIEYFHRQSKYVVSAQRIYEYYGYEWRLPLWDVDYLRFWSKVPIDLKYKQKLYKDMLYKENWSGVWRVPINRSNIRPKWIIPLRAIAKSFFLITGNNKKQWHKFENSVFKYWMDTGRVTVLFSYLQLLFNGDYRGVQSLISKKYLESNKISDVFH